MKKVIVLGAGIIGVTTAYRLAQRGCAVTVVDRHGGPAKEASFANAGEVSFGYCSPWAAPGVPRKAIKWLFAKHPPLVLRPSMDSALLGWLLRMLSNCTADRYALNKGRMLQLADYSRKQLKQVRDETGIEYDQRMLGTLQLFRTQKQLDASARDVEALRADGIPCEILDAAQCAAVEPALRRSRDSFIGGLRTPLDETGDCYKFANALAAQASDLGVDFRFNTNVLSLIKEGGRVSGVESDRGSLAADAVVVAMGSFSAALVQPFGIRLPVYPVKGYSLTIPISDAAGAPVSTVMDETFKVAITRLGDRIRVGGIAELSGYEIRQHPARRKTLEHSVNGLFGGGGDASTGAFWSGLRPMTPDGTPLICRTRLDGLYLNTGHGTLGWTMSMGSAALIADIVLGCRPALDALSYGLDRYAS